MARRKPKKFNFSFSYEELRDVGRKHYKDNNFCGVIATAVCCSLSFGIANAKLQRYGYRKRGTGTMFSGMQSVFESYGKRMSPVFDEHQFGKTLLTFSRNVPKDGLWIVLTRSHVAAVRDGVLEDWSRDYPDRSKIIGLYRVVDA